jgi:hypothetical protein
MAKYEINHTCGHTITHELFGKHSGFGGRDEKIEWLATEPCLECKRAEESQKRDALNRVAAEENLRAGLPALTGTEKQVLWGETIRRDTLATFASVFEKVPEVAKSAFAQTSEFLKTQTLAVWWIEKIGTLKTQEGLAPIFGLITGNTPKASPREILLAVLLDSPYLDEPSANAIGIGDLLRAKIQSRLAEAALAERKTELQASKPRCPAFVWEGAEKGATWNGKIYSGGRIYVANKEIRLNPEQLKELQSYVTAKTEWNKKNQSI